MTVINAADNGQAQVMPPGTKHIKHELCMIERDDQIAQRQARVSPHNYISYSGCVISLGPLNLKGSVNGNRVLAQSK